MENAPFQKEGNKKEKKKKTKKYTYYNQLFRIKDF